MYRFSIYGFHRYIHFLGFASIVKLIPASALRSLLISPIYQAKAAIIESTAISHYLTHGPTPRPSQSFIDDYLNQYIISILLSKYEIMIC